MSDKIYRFFKFEHFIDALQRKALAFVTYEMWPEDPYEGIILRLIETDEGRAQIANFLQRNHPTVLGPAVTMDMLYRFRRTVHLQSWTTRPDNDEMLRKYAHDGNAVCLVTSIKKVEKLDGISCVSVDYFDSLSVEDEIKRVVGSNRSSVHNLFTSKRKKYAYEKEMRLMTSVDNNYLRFALHNSVLDSFIAQSLRTFAEMGEITKEEKEAGLAQFVPDIKYIPFGHVESFIESVMVHPAASESCGNLVRQCCEENSIQFRRKFQL